MANTQSAKKHARQAVKRYAHNRWYRGRARTFVKRAREQMAQGNLEEASDAIRRACRALDKAAQKGAIHKNNAARRKSRLMRAFQKAQATSAS